MRREEFASWGSISKITEEILMKRKSFVSYFLFHFSGCWRFSNYISTIRHKALLGQKSNTWEQKKIKKIGVLNDITQLLHLNDNKWYCLLLLQVPLCLEPVLVFCCGCYLLLEVFFTNILNNLFFFINS